MVGLLGALLLVSCAMPIAPGTASPTAIPRPPLPTAAVCAGLPDDTTAPAPPAPDPLLDDTETHSAAQDSSMKFDTSQPVKYDVASNTIVLGNGAPADIPALARKLKRDDLLRPLASGEWLLLANLWIGKQVTFQIAAPSVQRLKLRSDTTMFASIKTYGGRLTFDGVCVTSWDTVHNTVATDYSIGRSFVLARDGARMDILNSEMSYLGFLANESYGVAWRLPGTTGSASNSRFGHNFYGLYSYEASDLVIRGNEVHHSIRYGIDPHTRSNRLLIENNISHHNGKQGIILAEECNDSTIRNNTVYANSLHGIVIYQRSNHNLVEGNTSFGNALQGININDSSGNTIRGNTVYENAEVGIGVGQNAADNLVVGNTVRNNGRDGIYLFSEAIRNTIRDNTVHDNVRFGIYAKSAGNTVEGNHVSGNPSGDVRE